MSRFVPRALRGQPGESEHTDEFSARRREAEEPETEAAAAADTSAEPAEDAARKPAAPPRRRPAPRATKPASAADNESPEADTESPETDAEPPEADTESPEADAEPPEAERFAGSEDAGPDATDASRNGRSKVSKPGAAEDEDDAAIDLADADVEDVEPDDEDVESEAGGRSRRGGGDRGRSRKQADSGAGKGPAKRGSAGRKVVAPRVRMSRRAKAAQAAVGRVRRTALAVGIWALIFAVLAGVAFYLKSSQAAESDAERDATTAAGAAAKAIFSYDYRTFDQSVSNGLTFTTGDFRKEYRKTTKSLEATAKKEKAIVVADVKAVSVADKPKECPGEAEDCVDVLLYVNQRRSNVNIEGQKADQNRVVLTMVKVTDKKTGEPDWLVNGALAI